MLLRSLVVLGLASFSLALPTSGKNGTESDVYTLDSYTDDAGVEKRAAAITSELHERLIYWSEWATAAYCPPQQGKGGGKVTCDPAKTCGRVEKSNTKIYTTWLE
jgi:hypothetical protein